MFIHFCEVLKRRLVPIFFEDSTPLFLSLLAKVTIRRKTKKKANTWALTREHYPEDGPLS
jgi:general stress protein 26